MERSTNVKNLELFLFLINIFIFGTKFLFRANADLRSTVITQLKIAEAIRLYFAYISTKRVSKAGAKSLFNRVRMGGVGGVLRQKENKI